MNNGLLKGVRVVELASEHAAYAGKLLADMGANVIVVEPPGGHHSRRFAPFVDDIEDPERSLWWWHYNTSKRSVTIDLSVNPELFRLLVGQADIVLEGERPGALHELGVDYDDLHADLPDVIWVTVTPFGRDLPRSEEVAVDLTVLAAGGPVWSCGYDDHSIAPIRGGGNQGYHTASIWAVIGALTALLGRDAGHAGGQRVDINMHAAANVTTEMATYSWLVAQQVVQRQTGRHATVNRTTDVMAMGADGRHVTTGVPPRTAPEFQILLSWLEELGLKEGFGDLLFLEMAAEIDRIDQSQIGVDPVVTAMFGAGRDATRLIATHLSAYDFFREGQRRGLACGIIYSPEEVLADPHFQSRGFPVDVQHDAPSRSVIYPGAPFVASSAPYRITRAPHVGEHNDEIIDQLHANSSTEPGAVPARIAAVPT